MDNNFGALGEILHKAQSGVILLTGKTVTYMNHTAHMFFSKYTTLPDLMRSQINETLTNKSINDYVIKDKEECTFYIRIEVDKDNENDDNRNTLIIFTDTTEDKILCFSDRLTGVGNRLFFDKSIIELDNVYPVSLIFIDINGLKLVNDVFGHNNGDSLIKEVTFILHQSIRSKYDILCRLGGDEFVILLPKTDITGVLKVYCRIRELLEKSTLKPIKPSISFGHGIRSLTNNSFEFILNEAEKMMYKNKKDESLFNYRNILNNLRKDLALKSLETQEHSQRIAKIAKIFSSELNLAPKDLILLLELADYHDIGLSALPDELIFNRKIFTDEDRFIMEKHCEIGFRVVRAVPEFMHLSLPILHHHERWDGKGYPEHLRHNKINYFARIHSIIESYEAMTGYRPYNSILTHDTAIHEIYKNSGKKYDPKLVDSFLNISDRLCNI